MPTMMIPHVPPRPRPTADLAADIFLLSGAVDKIVDFANAVDVAAMKPGECWVAGGDGGAVALHLTARIRLEAEAISQRLRALSAELSRSAKAAA
jgi:hypothetical protein